jgi:hypothetical protein
MVDKVPIDILGAIFNSAKDFPEELELIEFLKVMNILQDFLKMFIGFQKVFLVIDLEALKSIEEEMVGKIGFNDLINDLNCDIGSDMEEDKLIIAIQLLDGGNIVGLED